MALVGYSDSEASSDEGAKPKQPLKSSTGSKPKVEKVVDSSNPRKIRVNLPAPVASDANGDSDERPAKKPRIGGGLGGFNSMLPAPKRANAPASAGGGLAKAPGRGLGSGVSLKTGAAPGFSREPMPEPETDLGGTAEQDQPHQNESANGDSISNETTPLEPKQEPVKVGNPMMFKPLSVARNTKKKKTISSYPGSGATSSPKPTTDKAETTPAPKPKPAKVSLFSMNTPESHDLTPAEPTEPTGAYTPLLYQTSSNTEAEQDPSTTTATPQTTQPSSSTSSSAQSLQTIASDLNLSASARRQLLGRSAGRHGDGSDAKLQAVNVQNFNTDEEWAANEELRAQGTAPVHNPVRAIAPGRHSLRQLVSAVSNQKDALEESFAAGKRTKKEAGSRYGW